MRALLFGGDGYVGRYLQRASTVIAGIVCRLTFARPHRMSRTATFGATSAAARRGSPPEWIVLLAAVHREPGHELHEYFDTNVTGAQNVVELRGSGRLPEHLLHVEYVAVRFDQSAQRTRARLLYPESAYGMSKLAAELVLEGWFRQGGNRRLVICRPGVIYGPGEQGNITRMIRAVRGGYFVFPGDRTVRKSYAYIEGLVDELRLRAVEQRAIRALQLRRAPDRDARRARAGGTGRVRLPSSGSVGSPSGPRRRGGGGPSRHVWSLPAPSDSRSQGAIPTHVVPRWLLDHDFGSAMTSVRRCSTGEPPHPKTSTSARSEHSSSGPVSGRVDAQIRAAVDTTTGRFYASWRSSTRRRSWARAPRCFGSRTRLGAYGWTMSGCFPGERPRFGALDELLASSSRRERPLAFSAAGLARETGRRPTRATNPSLSARGTGSARARPTTRRPREHTARPPRSRGRALVWLAGRAPVARAAATRPEDDRDDSLRGGHRRRARRRLGRSLGVACAGTPGGHRC